MKIQLARAKAAAVANLPPTDPLRLLLDGLPDEITPEVYLGLTGTVKRLSVEKTL